MARASDRSGAASKSTFRHSGCAAIRSFSHSGTDTGRHFIEPSTASAGTMSPCVRVAASPLPDFMKLSRMIPQVSLHSAGQYEDIDKAPAEFLDFHRPPSL
ncbi:hypothetical protein [Kitasatospora sp. NPDC007106]|uniref:hypothetical protein n=1 Tax=Kitasatospora sp. NPDC007106 TaxID=3156914 RepID=UPI0033CCDB87